MVGLPQGKETNKGWNGKLKSAKWKGRGKYYEVKGIVKVEEEKEKKNLLVTTWMKHYLR